MRVSDVLEGSMGQSQKYSSSEKNGVVSREAIEVIREAVAGPTPVRWVRVLRAV